jgi:DNA-binding SARP family transcriptional activator/tetratricopeptide (TPR) repeat protein
MWPPVEHPIGAPWRLELLGPPRLTGPGGRVEVAAPKANLLLWLVAAHWPTPVPRGWLTNVLYPNIPEREARRNLTNLLSRLGHWLPPRPLHAELDALRWDESAGVALDLAEFSTRAAAPDVGTLETARRLWRGPFLDGASADGSEELEDWLRIERRRWSERYVELLDRLVDAAMTGGRAREAERWARLALVEEPAAERFHRVRMLARREAGDRAGALAAFDEYVRAMADVDLTPDPRMVALRDEIARGSGERGGPSPTRAGVRAEPRGAEHPRGHPGAAPGEPRLVGREDLLNAASAALSAAARGRGPPIVLLRGAAGVGKSRVARALVERNGPATRDGYASRLVGHCHEATIDLPFAPFVEALDAALCTVEVGDLGVADVWLAELGRLLPRLQGQIPGIAPRPAPDADIRRQRLFQSVARFLGALPGPTLLLLEDVHWLDAASRSLLAALAHDASTTGLAILLTQRHQEAPPEISRLLGDLHRRGRLVRFDVEPLALDATRTLVDQLIADPTHELAAWVYHQTGGNPLYAIHLVRSLPAREATTGSVPNPDAIPEAISDLVGDTLDRLDPPARDLALAVAVCPWGAPFEFARAVAGVDEAPALDALDALVGASVLSEGAAGELVFSHDLVRRAVEGSMTAARRRSLHARAFRLLAETASRRPTDWAPRLAFHAIHGQLWREALYWSQIAADAAEGIAAGREAGEHLANALSALQRLTPSAETRRQAIELRLRMVGNLVALPMPRTESVLADAERDADAVEDAQLRLRLALARVTQLSVRGRVREGLPAAEALLATAHEVGDPRLLAHAQRALGLLSSYEGDLPRALGLLHEAIENGRRAGDQEVQLSALGTIAVMHGTRGEFASAQEALDRLAAEAAPLTTPLAASYIRTNVARVRYSQGRWAEAVREAEEAVARAREAGHDLAELIGSWTLGPALLGAGEPGAAVEALGATIAAHERADSRGLLDRLYGHLAIAEAALGNADGARRALARALTIAHEEGCRYGIALAAQASGALAVVEGDALGAAEHLRRAVDGFAALGAQPDVARCLARLARCTPDPAEAASASARALTLATELGLHDLAPTAGTTAVP